MSKYHQQVRTIGLSLLKTWAANHLDEARIETIVIRQWPVANCADRHRKTGNPVSAGALPKSVPAVNDDIFFQPGSPGNVKSDL